MPQQCDEEESKGAPSLLSSGILQFIYFTEGPYSWDIHESFIIILDMDYRIESTEIQENEL